MNPFTKAKIIGSGINPEVYSTTGAEYQRGDPRFVMSRGHLHSFAANPRKWLMGGDGIAETRATRWGTSEDCLLLTPDQVSTRLAVCPETYRDEKGNDKPWNWNANACKKFRADNAPRVCLKADEWTELNTAQRRLMTDEEVKHILEISTKQVFVLAEYADADTGLVVPVKMLLDLVPAATDPDHGKTLLDFKTTSDASYRSWQSIVFSKGYHWQAAMYLHGYTLATGEDRTDFRHIIQENEPPYEITKRFLTTEFLDLGQTGSADNPGYLDALKEYCQCLKTHQWRGYYDSTRLHIGEWEACEPTARMV